MAKRTITKFALIMMMIPCISACWGVSNASSVLMPDLNTEAKLLSMQTKNLDSNVAELALIAYKNAQEEGLARRPVLTIIDYSKPSTERRLWVIDLRKQKVTHEELVAHGKNSGGNYANAFSDQNGSLESSIGVYVTDKHAYNGKHGYSLRLEGLDKGYNDKAASRAIVVHGAYYVNDYLAIHAGRLGRSWGCPALDLKIVHPVIDEIKGGSVLFAYYPDKKWLADSTYLHG